MPITSTLPQPVLTSSRVVIDWSHLAQDARQRSEVEEVLAWVRSFPKREKIHVVLGGYRNHHTSRKLQSRLLALGCTVIARHAARGVV